MADRDPFLDGIHGRGGDKYSQEYRNGELWRKAFTSDPAPEAAPPMIWSSGGGGGGSSSGGGTSGGGGGGFTFIESMTWDLGRVSDKGKDLRESIAAKIIGALIFVLFSYKNAFRNHHEVIAILIVAGMTAIGATVPFVLGVTIEKTFKLAEIIFPYVFKAAMGTAVLATVALTYLHYVARTQPHHSVPAVVQVETPAASRSPSASTHHGKSRSVKRPLTFALADGYVPPETKEPPR